MPEGTENEDFGTAEELMTLKEELQLEQTKRAAAEADLVDAKELTARQEEMLALNAKTISQQAAEIDELKKLVAVGQTLVEASGDGVVLDGRPRKVVRRELMKDLVEEFRRRYVAEDATVLVLD